MNILTVTPARAIRRTSVRAVSIQGHLVDFAIEAYGFLLSSQPPRDYRLDEFADIIEQHYDVQSNTRNRLVVETLRAVQMLTDRYEATLH